MIKKTSGEMFKANMDENASFRCLTEGEEIHTKVILFPVSLLLMTSYTSHQCVFYSMIFAWESTSFADHIYGIYSVTTVQHLTVIYNQSL